jgi:hypothetical protein
MIRKMPTIATNLSAFFDENPVDELDAEHRAYRLGGNCWRG